VKSININGNDLVTDEDILSQSGIEIDTNIWTVQRKELEQNVLKNPMVESVVVRRKLPQAVEITIVEHDLIGYIRQDYFYQSILGNGDILPEVEIIDGNAPILIGFTEEEYIKRLANEFHNLPASILQLISEVYWQPTEENKNKILIYMSDGHVVNGTIRDFAE